MDDVHPMEVADSDSGESAHHSDVGADGEEDEGEISEPEPLPQPLPLAVPAVVASTNSSNSEQPPVPNADPVPVAPSPVKEHNTSGDDDGQICPICFDPWNNTGDHRLVSLRCGHLFGRECIKTWLKGNGLRCPQCNARARKSEIRTIYARCVKVVDTSDLDRAVHNYTKEMEARKTADLECAQLRMKYSLKVQECENLKNMLVDAQLMLKESRSASKVSENGTKLRSSQPSFMLSTCVELNQGCRVMDCNDILGVMVVSQQSTNPLFKGFGLKKLSLPEIKKCEYVHLHQKPIKDISFHDTNGLILTASLDKTIKITNCLNNSMVQSYQLDCEAWSCTWDLNDERYFYAGVRTGVINIFDIRMTGNFVQQLTQTTEMSPVVSLEYFSPRLSSHGKTGLVVARLGSCSFYDKRGSTSFEMTQLPLEGSFTSLSYERNTGLLLASCRPSMKHPHVTHSLCEVSFQQDTVQCNLVHILMGGNTQSQLTRSKLIPHPQNDTSVLVCAGDEQSASSLIWDGSTGSQVASLKADSPILDVAIFHKGHDTQLATLTEKSLRVYNWGQP